MSPLFVALDPEKVRIGKGAVRQKLIEQYAEAIKEHQAGLVQIDAEDGMRSVHDILKRAAKFNGMKIRAHLDSDARTITWKVVGA